VGKSKKKIPKYLIPTPPLDPPKPEKPVNLPVGLSFRHHREGEKWCLSLCEKDEIKPYLKAMRLLTRLAVNHTEEKLV
jgi:hypothetical protein